MEFISINLRLSKSEAEMLKREGFVVVKRRNGLYTFKPKDPFEIATISLLVESKLAKGEENQEKIKKKNARARHAHEKEVKVLLSHKKKHTGTNNKPKTNNNNIIYNISPYGDMLYNTSSSSVADMSSVPGRLSYSFFSVRNQHLANFYFVKNSQGMRSRVRDRQNDNQEEVKKFVADIPLAELSELTKSRNIFESIIIISVAYPRLRLRLHRLIRKVLKRIDNKPVVDTNSIVTDRLRKKKSVVLKKNSTALPRNAIAESIEYNYEDMYVTHRGKDITISSIHKSLLQEIFAFGLPFGKHKEGSNQYNRALVLIAIKYRRRRTNFLDIFKLAREYFKKNSFKWHLQKITVRQFLEYDDGDKQYDIIARESGVRSWFEEFAKGREYIESNYMTLPPDKHPRLTGALENLWLKHNPGAHVGTYEKRIILGVIDDFIKCCKIYSNIDGVIPLLSILDRSLFASHNDFKINSLWFFRSSQFYSSVLPRILVKNGTYRDYQEMEFQRLRYCKRTGEKPFWWKKE